jgi:hypothetical protein
VPSHYLFQNKSFPYRPRNALKDSPPSPKNSFVTYIINLRSPSLPRVPLVLISEIILSNFLLFLGPVLEPLKLCMATIDTDNDHERFTRLLLDRTPIPRALFPVQFVAFLM